ncbi:MAG: putative intracellular protease/amidase [Cocleimonas sp.]|jgi:putative intracellular protease/amidase
MLKRVQKILLVSLVLSGAAINAHADNILVVMSDQDHLKLKGTDVYATGFYLNELMQPVKMFTEAGHDITFATPNGSAPSLDVVSDNVMFFGTEDDLVEHKQLLEKLMITDPANSPVISLTRVEQIGYSKYDAIYVPGGHAPMNDLLKDKRMGKLLNHFHDTKKVTALVCHGPIALLSTMTQSEDFVSALENGKTAVSDPKWTYAGYKMTVFSNKEELASQSWLGGGEMKFYPQDALKLAGGQYSESKELWNPNVVIDRELITGQNPASAVEVAKNILQRLSQ